MKNQFVLAFLALSACNSSSFQGASGHVPVAKKSGADGNPAVTIGPPGKKPQQQQIETGSDGTVTETFALDAPRGALDLVWVIDNSGSMGDKTAKVRKNFERFMGGVESTTDLRVILMSLPSGAGSGGATGGPTGGFPGFGDLGITLSDAAKAKGHVQISMNVGSYNPMAMAAAATCPKDQTKALGAGAGAMDAGLTICGKDFHPTQASEATANMTAMMRSSFEDPETIVASAGVFLPFFREGAQRAYVFVTDEDSFVFEGAAFAEAVRKADPKGAARIFAFRGAKANMDVNAGFPPSIGAIGGPTLADPGIPECAVSFAGKAYDKAQETLGGQMFDICADDWSPQFDGLSSTVAQLARNRFELKTSGFKKVAGIEVDGKALPAGAFKVDGQVVTINATNVSKDAKTVKIMLAT